MSGSDELNKVFELLPSLSDAELAEVGTRMNDLSAERKKAKHDSAVAELRRIASESGISVSIKKRRYRRRNSSKPKAAA